MSGLSHPLIRWFAKEWGLLDSQETKRAKRLAPILVSCVLDRKLTSVDWGAFDDFEIDYIDTLEAENRYLVDIGINDLEERRARLETGL